MPLANTRLIVQTRHKKSAPFNKGVVIILGTPGQTGAAGHTEVRLLHNHEKVKGHHDEHQIKRGIRMLGGWKASDKIDKKDGNVLLYGKKIERIRVSIGKREQSNDS